MLPILSIVLAIAFSNFPPQTTRGETQGPSVASMNAADPPEGGGGTGGVIDPPDNQGGGSVIDPPDNQGGGDH